MTSTDLRMTADDLGTAREILDRGARGVVPALLTIMGISGLVAGALAATIAGVGNTLELALLAGLFTTAIGVPLGLIVGELIKRRGVLLSGEQVVQQRLLETEVHRREFETQLGRALEMADDEEAAYDVISRAMALALPGRPVELLLADNSHAHLEQVVAFGANGSGAPDCPVEAPDRCVAARRAQTQVFTDSEELDACAMLRTGERERCSAVCVPVSIMGTTVGVAHTIGPVGEPSDRASVEALQALANLAGNRLGMLRIMAETQLQASTDGLTGLINRRSLENQARRIRQAGEDFALVVADLDHFKSLNDTHGHDTGDRALRVFAEAMRTALRSDDLACRYGGEEFVILLPGESVDDALAAVERVRDALAVATQRGDVPTFTASFGLAHSRAADDFEGTVHLADRALFEAKRTGRNRACVHGRDCEPHAEPEPAVEPAVEPDFGELLDPAGRHVSAL